jgi:hypothetical protein
MEVPLLEAEIPKIDLMARLEEEAPHIMRTLLDLQLPKSGCRLRVPVIETEDKMRTISDNRSALEEFLDEQCEYLPGAATLLVDLHSKFLLNLEKFEHNSWSKNTMKCELPDKFPVGKWNRNQTCVGNLVFRGENVEGETGSVFILQGGRLIRETLLESDDDN